MPVNRIPVLSKVVCEKMVTTPSVVVVVGLPGTAKTFLSRKLCNYLNWIQIKTKSFIVEYYRTKNLPEHLAKLSDKLFTDEYNDETMAYLDFCYKSAVDDIHRWLDTENGHIAIIDGTSSTVRRRRWLTSRLSPKYKIFFVENLSNRERDFFEDNDPTSLSTIQSDMEHILQSDQMMAESMQRPLNTQMMHARMNFIRNKYETLDSSCPEENKYIQIVDIGHKFVVNRLHGRIPSLVAYYLMNLRLNAGCMYIVRHGESQFNLEARIGGDSSLSVNGQQFADVLSNVFTSEGTCHKVNSVLTSTLKRTQQTVKPLLDKIPHLKVDHLSNLDEINAGKFDGMTYKQLAEQHGAEFSKRDQDKFSYRYPFGESYQDLIARLEPVILYLERKENVLVVCHQAVARCLISYFLGKSCEEIPYMKVELHTLYKLHFHSYQTVCEQIPLGVKSVCTHRPCPKNVLPNRSVEEALSTISIQKKRSAVSAFQGQQKRKLDREEDKLIQLNRTLTLIKTKAILASSLIFFVTFRTFSKRYQGVVVATLPFDPLPMLRRVTHRSLDGVDYSECSFAFYYVLCVMCIKQHVQRLFGFPSMQKHKIPLFAGLESNSQQWSSSGLWSGSRRSL